MLTFFSTSWLGLPSAHSNTVTLKNVLTMLLSCDYNILALHTVEC